MENDDLSLLIPQHYRKAIPEEQTKMERGQIFRCPSFYVEEKMELLDLTYVDPDHKRPPMFEIRSANRDAFSKREHKPVIEARLEIDEEFVAVRAKERKVVVFSSHTETWRFPNRRAREEKLILPFFSFHEDEALEFKLKVRAFAYKELFYLPRNDVLRLLEGFIRFDRAQVVPKTWLYSAGGICLTDEALSCLTIWFQFYLTGIANDDVKILLQYREKPLKNIEAKFGESS